MGVNWRPVNEMYTFFPQQNHLAANMQIGRAPSVREKAEEDFVADTNMRPKREVLTGDAVFQPAPTLA